MSSLEEALIFDLYEELRAPVVRLLYSVMMWCNARHIADGELMALVAPVVVARAGVIRTALRERPGSVVEGVLARLAEVHGTPSLADMLKECLAERPNLDALADREIRRKEQRERKDRR